jgi:hypothetical protein
MGKTIKRNIKNRKSNLKSKTYKSTYPSKTTYDPTKDFFQTNARLNASQRKYCHCLMNVRDRDVTNIKEMKTTTKTRKKSKKISPYPICISFLKKRKLLDYSLKTNSYNYKKSQKTPPKVNPKITHCLMNYDLYKYNIRQIRDLAREKKIPIYYIQKSAKFTKSRKIKKYLDKNTLISKIKSNYFKNKSQKAKNPKTQKLLNL